MEIRHLINHLLNKFIMENHLTIFEEISKKSQRLILETIIGYLQKGRTAESARRRIYRLLRNEGETKFEAKTNGDLIFNHYL